MVERAQRGTRRAVTAVVLVVCALALAGNVFVSLLPRSNDAAPHKVPTRSDLIAAYSRILPGRTRASQLSQYGFDPTSTGAQVLSYLGMMERFMPHDSVGFDHLDPAIKDCVAMQDHCTAMVFNFSNHPRVAATLFAAFAPGADAASPTPQVTFLIRDGRVAFKTIAGVEHASPVDRQARAIPVPFRMAY